MSRHDDKTRMRHMLNHAIEAVKMARGRTREELDSDRQLNLSLVRLLEIIGEAANRITESTQAKHPEIPWIQIIGLRNRLIHGYDEVDHDILWDIIQLDMPPLIKQLRLIPGVEDSQGKDS